jgi:leukotriene A-4 hydrolase/aminopeptidase
LKKTFLPFLILPVFIWTCTTKHQQNKTQNMAPQDIHSFAQPDEAIVKHLSLDLHVDFDKEVLSGKVILKIENKTGTDTLHLDSRDLNINKVFLDDNSETTFTKGDRIKYLGQELKIKIKPDTKTVTIEYSTMPGAAALQWLLPEQTAGGKYPFLFTQSQAILARTWIPLQDSPGIKFTYDATIRCPKELMAVMSAGNDSVKHDDGVYRFEMPQPIPSYLMALAVGDLSFHSYNNICGVFAEPALIEKCAYEFADMPKMISSAEELYGKYQWGRYDVLVLPPSFPFGGMENPRITFATPTIIAGDRSLVALIAHELAHSWSGNLVTNATWNDFWLNEGFTVYFETRIMEKIYGKDYADMLTLLELNGLKETVKEMGDTTSDTKLFLDLKDRDPDDGVTDIAYQKGRFFLTVIEQNVGREKWDAFLNTYFNTFAFQSMTTDKFLAYLDKELIKNDTALKNKINIDAWVFGTGLPGNCPMVTSVELNKAGKAAGDFKKGVAAKQLDTKNWTTHHWLYFLRNVGDTLTAEKMKELDDAFHFTQSGNSEIQCDWYLHCISNKYTPAYPYLEKFLMTVGRRKFLKPLYTELAKTPDGLQMAKTIYAKARPGYHAVSSGTIDEILGK